MLKNKFTKILTFVLICVFTFSSLQSVFANSVKFNIEITNEGKTMPDVSLKYWKISNEKSVEKAENLKKELEELSETELDAKFSKAVITEKSNEKSIVSVSLEDDATYYFRDENPDKTIVVSPFVLIVPKGHTGEFDIKGKVVVNKFGKVNILKTAEDGKLLENVKFNLLKDDSGNRTVVTFSKVKKGYVYDVKGNEQTLVTGKDGEINISKLPLGRYILKEIETLDGYKLNSTEFEIVISNDSLEKELKIINKKDEKGSKKFLKISDDKNKSPLENATFKVVTKNGDVFEDVKKDGKTYVVTSDKDGMFEVEDLPFGKYFLVETKAPKGHQLLSKPVEFDISSKGRDEKEVIVTVVNKKIPPIQIPKTGDIRLILLSVVSVVFIGIGLVLIREKKKNS